MLTTPPPHTHTHASSGAYEPAQKFPQLIFLKDLTYRTSDVKHATKASASVAPLESARTL